MLYVKRSVIFVLAFCFLINTGLVSAAPAGPKWYTSHEKALEAAQKSDKPVLVLFTGSDWCKFCKLLQEEVLQTKEFQDWAKKNVILLEVDFPKGKEQSQEIVEQNNQLQKEYNVSGFPTIIILDSAGQPIAKLGYAPGKAQEWLEYVKQGIERYYQFRMVEPKAGFTEALKDAKSQQRVLLVLQNSQDTGETIGQLLTNQDVVALAGSGMDVVVHGQMSDIDDVSAYEKFAQKHDIAQAKIVMIDAAKDKVMYKSDQLPSADKLVDQLVEAFPKVPYGGKWIENYDKAVTIASQQDRAILLNFTGSDWCKWCIKMEKEVMDQEQFKEYAKDNLVLVKVDFPRKREISKETKKQNRRLEKKYDRQGFPNVVLTDADGKELGRIKYRQQGIDGFMNTMKGFLQTTTQAQGQN